VLKLNTGEDISEMYQMLKVRNCVIAEMALVEFGLKDRVWFEGRRGARIEGTITKINKSTATVKADGSVPITWRVHASHLHKL